LNRFGYAVLNQGDAKGAIRVFQLNAEKFPESSNVWDSLGEVHLKRGNHREALRCYRHSLTLNPENANARRMIEQIGSEK